MSAERRADLTRTAKVARVLAVIAAVLGFSALVARYVRTREMDFTALGGGALMLMIAFTTGRKRK